jgi:hypothetical protein
MSIHHLLSSSNNTLSEGTQENNPHGACDTKHATFMQPGDLILNMEEHEHVDQFTILSSLEMGPHIELDKLEQLHSSTVRCPEEINFMRLSPMLNDVDDLTDEESMQWFSTDSTDISSSLPTEGSEEYLSLSRKVSDTDSTDSAFNRDYPGAGANFSFESNPSSPKEEVGDPMHFEPINEEKVEGYHHHHHSMEEMKGPLHEECFPKGHYYHEETPLVLDPEVFVSDFFTSPKSGHHSPCVVIQL